MGLLPGGFRYTEEEIMAVYEDLLSIPGEREAAVETREDESFSPSQILQRAVQRLLPERTDVAGNMLVHRALISRLEDLAGERKEYVEGQSTDIASPINEQEWQALIQFSVSLASTPNILCLHLILS